MFVSLFQYDPPVGGMDGWMKTAKKRERERSKPTTTTTTATATATATEQSGWGEENCTHHRAPRNNNNDQQISAPNTPTDVIYTHGYIRKQQKTQDSKMKNKSRPSPNALQQQL